MSYYKKNFEALETNAEILKNMGHPLRLAIIHLLIKHTTLNVTDIYTYLEIEQAVASHHLRLMKKSKIVQSRKVGKNALYSLAGPSIKIIFETLTD